MNCSAPTQEHVLIRVNLRHCARVLLHLLLPSVFQSCPRTRYQQLGPARFSYLRLWRSIRSMYRFNTENAMWTEWCNSRNTRLFWWIRGSWSQKNKEFETAQVTAGREAEREERERVICWWVSCWNCNKGESLAQLHCFLYQWQLPPPPSLFHWMKFPTSSLFTLFTYIPRSNFPPPRLPLAFLLSVTRSVRWHFSVGNTARHPVWNRNPFFPTSRTLKGRFYLSRRTDSPFLLSLPGLLSDENK